MGDLTWSFLTQLLCGTSPSTGTAGGDGSQSQAPPQTAAVTASSQQGAGVRSMANEARSKTSLVGGGKKMRSCRGMPFIPPAHPTAPPPHLQMHISHPASRSRSHQPAPSPSAFSSPTVLNSLYLSHQDTWHSIPRTTLTTVFSKWRGS